MNKRQTRFQQLIHGRVDPLNICGDAVDFEYKYSEGERLTLSPHAIREP
ncbi:MAG: hypothetical protein J07HQX50_01810 [Haloquadratum sp. J07HQX50]|nr:MAG: hypothetical protein J07HQX50_01810 [Haloquadratum sp. J07HQX50]